MFQNNLLMAAASIGAGGLTVDDSVRFNDDDSPRLYRTPTVEGNRMTGSLSLWYKRCNLGSIQQLFNAGAGDDITFNASDKLTFTDSTGVSYITTQVFRDPTAWGNLLFAWDTTLATAGDRLRIYHNGVEITAFDTETDPGEGDAFQISNTVRQTIGANESDTEEFDGYLSQFYYVDGIQNVPTDFGEFDDNGVWRPIAFAADGTGYTGDVVPVMTAATVPSGEVTETGEYSASYAGYKAFNHLPWASANEGWINSGTGAAFIAYEFASSKTIIMYTIMSRNAGESPEDFTFDGWNGSAWIELDSVTGESWTGTGQTKVYTFSNTTAYIKYRLNTTLVQTHATEYCAVMNLTMHEASSGYGTNGFFLDFADSSEFGLYGTGANVLTDHPSAVGDYTGDVSDFTFDGDDIVGATDKEIHLPGFFVGDCEFEFTIASGSDFGAMGFFDATEVGTIASSGGTAGMSLMTNSWYFEPDNTLSMDVVYGGADVAAYTFTEPSTQKMTRVGAVFKVYLGGVLQHTYTQEFSGPVGIAIGGHGSQDWEELKWSGDNYGQFISSGLAAADQMSDTPTTNFCVISSIDKSSSITLSDGNLVATFGGWINARATFNVPSSGKWSFQGQAKNAYVYFGVVAQGEGDGDLDTNGTDALYYYGSGGKIATRRSGSEVVESTNAPPAVGVDTNMEVLIDKDNDQFGVVIADTVYMAVDAGLELQDTMTKIFVQGLNLAVTVDFGQGGYEPSQTGYKALSTANLPTPTILDGTANFQTTLYTGNGSVRNIDQTGNSTFQPDWVWIKNRSTTDPNMWIDAARGVTKELNCETNGIETTDADGLTSFDSDGFGLGTGAGGYNDDTESFVAWQWLAGGGAGSANADGSTTTTTTTVNTTAGISISTYTGTGANATIGHGLGVAPEVVVCKQRDGSLGPQWYTYHVANTSGGAAEDYFLILGPGNQGTYASSTKWNDTAPTSTVFSLGTDADLNGSTLTYISYAMVGVEGFSKFGGYTGNGDADGTYTYTGFKPALVIIKKAEGTAVGDWIIYDSARSPYNEVDDQLITDYARAETTGSEELDFLSNGFKIRTTDTYINASASRYVYMAFAEYPFGGDGVTPATAF